MNVGFRERHFREPVIGQSESETSPSVRQTSVLEAPREAPSPAKAATPAAEREDRDEGFDEVMTKDATFGYWKDKDREAGSAEASPKPSPKPSPNKGKAATSPSP